MNPIRAFWHSTIGKKVVMAITGLVMVLYLILHVAGNLLIFGGPEVINGYAEILHHRLTALLWLARVVLIISVVLHIVAGFQLTVRSKEARPIGYDQRALRASGWASRSMRWGGVLIGAFIVFHLLHLTTGTIRPARFVELDDYGNLVRGFKVGWVVVAYLIAMAAVGLHLYHGDWAWWRTLGFSRPAPEPRRRTLAALVAGFVFIAFTLIPLVILFGGLR